MEDRRGERTAPPGAECAQWIQTREPGTHSDAGAPECRGGLVRPGLACIQATGGSKCHKAGRQFKNKERSLRERFGVSSRLWGLPGAGASLPGQSEHPRGLQRSAPVAGALGSGVGVGAAGWSLGLFCFVLSSKV